MNAIADLPGATPGRRQRGLAVIRNARALEGDVSLRKKAFDGRLKKPLPFGARMHNVSKPIRGLEFCPISLPLLCAHSRQELILWKSINVGFIQRLHVDNPADLVATLTYTILDEVVSFRRQDALAINELSDHPEVFVHPDELSQTLSCNIDSAVFHVGRMKGPVPQNG
jgi:hypothetical protein